MINVFILTFCRNLDLFYGTSLIFKTLRTGFPNARVTVTDNASLPETRAEIASLARQNDCIFHQLQPPGIQHHDFLESTLRATDDDSKIDGPVVFWIRISAYGIPVSISALMDFLQENPSRNFIAS
jgi:hypothetical protein